MLHVALEAAEAAARDGIDVEVLDLRTLLPLDEEAILATAAKTGKVIVLHEATRTAGRAARSRRSSPSAPSSTSTRRSCAWPRPTRPVPYSPPLEEAFLPNAETGRQGHPRRSMTTEALACPGDTSRPSCLGGDQMTDVIMPQMGESIAEGPSPSG